MAGGAPAGQPPPPTKQPDKRSFRPIVILIRDRFHAAPGGRLIFRILVGLLGLVLVTIGLLLVPLPGPGWLIVFAGVAVWAIEFVWARRLLRFARAQLQRWNAWMRRQHWLVRVPLLLALFAVIATAVWLSLKHGLGIDPFKHVFGADEADASSIDPVR
jgi:uncharacterized protein (TIGR02611 family)